MSRLRDALKRHLHQVTHPVETIKHQAKSAVRHAAPVYTKVSPYLAAVGTGVLSYFFTPAVGAAAGALAAVDARYAGATAARAKGKHGLEARDAGRALRERTIIASAIGVTAGSLTALAAGSSWVGSIFAAAPAAPAAPAGVGAGVGALEGAGAGVAAGAPIAPGALAGATTGIALGSSAAAAAAAAAPAATSLIGQGTGLLGSLTSTATNLLSKVLTPQQQAQVQPLLDLAGAKFGGEGSSGTGDTSTEAGGPADGKPGSGISPVVKVIGLGGAAVLGWVVIKKLRKAA